MTSTLASNIARATAFAATLLPLGGGFAQDAAEPPRSDTLFYVANGAVPVMPLGGAVDFIGAEGSVIGEVVVGKPYSADSVTESAQALADGNRITSTNRARIYRDSQGRTRREHTLGGVGVWQAAGEPATIVTINDPVKHVSYFLETERGIAREVKPFTLATKPFAAGELPAEDANVVIQEEFTTPRESGVWIRERVVPGAPAGAGVGAGVEPFEIPLPPPGAGAAGPGERVESALPPQRVMAIRGAAISAGAIAAFGGEADTEDLGEQVLEGVLARGTRQTHTIAAGAIGNELPIEIVNEQWYSPDLQAIVLRRSVDPRFGETTYRLINVDRSEPSPELFVVPQDYEIVSDPGPGVGMRRFRSGPAVEGEPGTPVAGQRFERRVFLVQPDPAKAKAGADDPEQ
jgi:hypothetical protein